ncbi:MAG: hypothetical protein MI865_06280 [Proteobacteria bacterium]|nr:hypothetical protein [Pseudomonadota bacterium]
MYCVCIAIALPIFFFIHEKLDNKALQYFWDKIGMPLLRVLLIIGFILMVYPVNFGLVTAPPLTDLFSVDDMRSSFLINLVFFLTFFFPMIPLIGKWEELLIPLQGILCSMIIFSWLCQELSIQDYLLFPDIRTLGLIVIISLITHCLAEYFSEHTGDYLDNLYHREGFKELVFKGVVLIMQSPVIFIFGLFLGKQIN